MRRGTVIFVCVWTLALAATHSSNKADEPDGQLVWRDADHGGLNVLYLFLRVHGWTGSYLDLMAKSPTRDLPATLSDLKATARNCGWSVRGRRLSPADLYSLDLPAIIHVDGDSPGTGAFLLFLGINKTQVLYCDGPSATVQQLDRESFLRRWSGVVLEVDRDGDSFHFDLATGILSSVAITALILRHRRQR